jgi:hypothetical protein
MGGSFAAGSRPPKTCRRPRRGPAPPARSLAGRSARATRAHPAGGSYAPIPRRPQKETAPATNSSLTKLAAVQSYRHPYPQQQIGIAAARRPSPPNPRGPSRQYPCLCMRVPTRGGHWPWGLRQFGITGAPAPPARAGRLISCNWHRPGGTIGRSVRLAQPQVVGQGEAQKLSTRPSAAD